MEEIKIGTIESLMVQEYLTLKDKVAALEKENGDLKRSCLMLKQDRNCMLLMLMDSYSSPRIDRDEDGNITYMYSGGSSVSWSRNSVDQATLTRVAKAIEEKMEENKEDK